MVLRIICFELVIGGLIFGSAGRVDLPWVWALLGIHTAFVSLMLGRMSPELLRERLRPGKGPGPLCIDARLRRAMLITILIHLVIVGLDIRFAWSDEISTALRLPALMAYASALGLCSWAMSTNRFFSSVVRLQRDRGQHVVTAGPYRLIRHPGYAGMLGALGFESIALGSWWALVPVCVAMALLVYRTRMEDRFLHAALEGYGDYAARVRYRLLPCVW